MTFVDSNIPMYLVGAPHPHRTRAAALLERLVRAGEVLVTDAEVFQEILHRYTAIARPEAIEPAWAALAGVVDEVLPIELPDVESARLLLAAHPGLSARDAVHAAVAGRYRIDRLLTFDAGFDRVPGLTRLA